MDLPRAGLARGSLPARAVVPPILIRQEKVAAPPDDAAIRNWLDFPPGGARDHRGAELHDRPVSRGLSKATFQVGEHPGAPEFRRERDPGRQAHANLGRDDAEPQLHCANTDAKSGRHLGEPESIKTPKEHAPVFGTQCRHVVSPEQDGDARPGRIDHGRVPPPSQGGGMVVDPSRIVKCRTVKRA